ncbi:four helix bundle protein [candidate division KSB1 bacterium]|nr:four helix bundle protein [candidate division KSB1 bacterium]
MLQLNHKQLDVWKKGVEFVTDIYKITDCFPKSEIYGLASQIRRAAVSVASNIAEGAARRSRIERKRFFEVARSSLVEIDTQLVISMNLLYCSKDELRVIEEQMNHIFAMLSNLISKTK